ncbi:MAG: heme-copper oxidase subunit III [Terriglobia bacterium]
MGATTLTKPETRDRVDDIGRGGNRPGGGDFGGRQPWDAYGPRVPARTYKIAMWMALTAIVMFFAAITSALIVRKGLSDDWVATPLPRVLWLNMVILLASSATLELSRRGLMERARKQFAFWLYATAGLGMLFLAGQLVAWRELAARGVYLASNPSSSFFYLFTAAHGLHLLGGVIALLYVVTRARAIAAGRERRTAVDVAAIYWHFMDGLWIYILLLLTTRF